MKTPFVLFCAGEDSGDVLGEAFVASVLRHNVRTLGTGGPRMQAAGLEPVADFDELPVSGFWDVLPRVFRLRSILTKLKLLLAQEECVAFVALDYPGFNMELCRLATRLKKKALFAAPPQIWAWKPGRAKDLQGIPLAVLFEFERKVYADRGCNPQLLLHPFLLHDPLYHESPSAEIVGRHQETLLLLPGSRESQALRNLPLFLKVASLWLSAQGSGTAGNPRQVCILASRQSLRNTLEKKACRFFRGQIPEDVSIETAPESPEERRALFARASCALATPGTATLELALSGTPLVVATKPDFLTYVLGSLFVKASFFAMPNILMGEKFVPEHIGRCSKKMACAILEDLKEPSREQARILAKELHEKLAHGNTPEHFIEGLLNGQIS